MNTTRRSKHSFELHIHATSLLLYHIWHGQLQWIQIWWLDGPLKFLEVTAMFTKQVWDDIFFGVRLTLTRTLTRLEDGYVRPWREAHGQKQDSGGFGQPADDWLVFVFKCDMKTWSTHEVHGRQQQPGVLTQGRLRSKCQAVLTCTRTHWVVLQEDLCDCACCSWI